MKICPFLVAGQDVLQRRSALPRREAPVVTAQIEVSPDEVEKLQAVETVSVEKSLSAEKSLTQLWTLEDKGDSARSAFECLGEPCRFFHAGGCRFDVLFETGVAGVGTAATALLVQEGESDAGVGSVLQEVWSLQRESLKEMIGGFRRLEGEQNRQQGSLAGRIEQLVSRVEEGRGTAPDLVHTLEERFATLQNNVATLEGTLHAGIRNLEGTVHTLVGDSASGTKSQMSAVEAARATVAEARDESRRLLQENLESTRRILSQTAEETRARLEQLVAQNSTTSRVEMETSLQHLLDDNQNMRVLREEMRRSLQTLSGHVQEVAAAAASLSSSSRVAEDLLVEQRTLAEALLERDRRDEARRLNNVGVLAYHEGSYDTSVEKFRQATALDPNLTEAWNNLGLSFTEMHADDRALDAFKRALELDPSVGQVYNNLGYLYYRRDELEQAVEMYERATQRSSDTSAAWSNLGNALHALQRRDEAFTAWKRALELDPANDKAAGALERLGFETGR